MLSRYLNRSSVITVIVGIALLPGQATAMSDADVDKLTTYAVMLGRGLACGVDTTGASKKVGAWLNRIAPPGSKDQQIYLPLLMQGMMYHGERQKEGKNPDSCATVHRVFGQIPWP